jgi:hypothetical protein
VAINPKLRKYYLATKEDRVSPGKYHTIWRAVSARDDKRIRYVRQLLKGGRLTTGTEFYEAAYILHHSAEYSDYAVACLLAALAHRRGVKRPMRELSARDLERMARDRFLKNIGQAQWHGTQFSLRKVRGTRQPGGAAHRRRR